ncbi:TPA: histidinol-phosphate aminotransferase family protein, partial [Candidatus Poribacteria bacterium]|nr:histidinol-phosphate aminotransferase family protein [Candidatus Poribacteria bacterium]
MRLPQFEHGGEIYKLKRLGMREEGLIDFSVNLNPLGPPKELIRLLRERLWEIGRYPEGRSESLRSKLAGWLGVPDDCLIVSNGSTQLIYAACRALRPRRVLILQPTFSEYERAATRCGAHISEISLKPDDGFKPRADELIDRLKRVDMAFICNPNNPTGRLLERDLLLDLVRRFPEVAFVLDEAFIDFADRPSSLLGEAKGLMNLIVLRSPSKLLAVPGLRLGYAVSNPQLIRKLEDEIELWSVNTLAQLAGEMLPKLEGFIEEGTQLVRKEREFLRSELSKIEGMFPFPSQANFLLVRLKGISSRAVQMR